MSNQETKYIEADEELVQLMEAYQTHKADAAEFERIGYPHAAEVMRERAQSFLRRARELLSKGGI